MAEDNESVAVLPTSWFGLLALLAQTLQDLKIVGLRIALALEADNRRAASSGGVGFVSRYTNDPGASDADAALELAAGTEGDLARLWALEEAYTKTAGMAPPPDVDLDAWATTEGLENTPPPRRGVRA